MTETVQVFLLLLGLLASAYAAENNGFELLVASELVAFAGDVAVTFRLPADTTLANAVLELRTLPSNDQLQSFPIPRNVQTATMTIYCGTIDHEGAFVLRLMSRTDGEVLVQQELDVRWPRVNMQIDPDHETSSNPVTLQFSTQEDTQCASRHANVNFTFEIIKYNDYLDEVNGVKMFEISVRDFNRFKETPLQVNCEVFDIAGIYQVQFFSSRQPLVPIARSNKMDVTWSSEYVVSALDRSVFPCEVAFTVRYEQPRCVGAQDRIRLYRQVRQIHSSTAGLISEVFVNEARAQRGRTEAAFLCDLFSPNDYGYCFRYVSFARNGAMREQDSICVPSIFTPDPVVNGLWGEWTAWSTCSSSCQDGRRYRHRLCDSPAPSGVGDQCQGLPNDSELCGVLCPAPTSEPPMVYTPAPNCRCGCQLVSSSGTIVSSPSCRGSAVWVITAPKNHVIQLTFRVYTLDPNNAFTRLTVRDGASSQSDLLVRDDGSLPPSLVETKRNQMRIEFVTPVSPSAVGSPGYGLMDEGFVATFLTREANITISGGFFTNMGWSKWSTTMLLVGIFMIIIIIAITIAFICYHHHNQKRYRQKLQGHQALLSNGEAASSPTHSNSAGTVPGSTNLSFGDPVGSSPEKKSKRRSYVAPKSDPSSPVKLNDVDLELKQSKKKSKHHVKHKVPKSASDAFPEKAAVHVSRSTPSKSEAQSPTLASPSSQTVDLAVKPMSPRSEARNKSFLNAVQRRNKEAPMAGQEDLSPTTPTNPNVYMHKADVNRQGNNESIPLQVYSHSSDLIPGPGAGAFEQRPPTEGRDSFHKKSTEDLQLSATGHTSFSNPYKHSEPFDPVGMKGRPDIKPLPLRYIQRPDGQSPDQKEQMYSSQSEVSSGLSPVLQKTQLFGSRTPSTLDLTIDAEYEYDDSIYVPDLPNTYFNMDPSAYTLTWQQQPKWSGQNSDPTAKEPKPVQTGPQGSFC